MIDTVSAKEGAMGVLAEVVIEFQPGSQCQCSNDVSSLTPSLRNAHKDQAINEQLQRKCLRGSMREESFPLHPRRQKSYPQ